MVSNFTEIQKNEDKKREDFVWRQPFETEDSISKKQGENETVALSAGQGRQLQTQ